MTRVPMHTRAAADEVADAEQALRASEAALQEWYRHRYDEEDYEELIRAVEEDVDTDRQRVAVARRRLWQSLPAELHRLLLESASAAWAVSDAEAAVRRTCWQYAAGVTDDEAAVDAAEAVLADAYRWQQQVREALKPWRFVVDRLAAPDPWTVTE